MKNPEIASISFYILNTQRYFTVGEDDVTKIEESEGDVLIWVEGELAGKYHGVPYSIAYKVNEN